MSINLVTPDIHLFAKTAEDAAKMIANSSNQRMNKATQLRGFYDEILNWEQRSRQLDKEQFKAQLPLIHSQVTDKTTLKHCKLFFEAFMGFYKVYGPK